MSKSGVIYLMVEIKLNQDVTMEQAKGFVDSLDLEVPTGHGVSPAEVKVLDWDFSLGHL